MSEVPFIGPWEVALILVIVFIVFGPKRIPELARGIGDAMRNFREASDGRPPAPQVNETAARRVENEGKTGEEVSRAIAAKSSRRRQAVKRG